MTFLDDLPDPGPDACKTCEGCGQIGDNGEGVPWSVWQALPPGSDIAVKMGWVKPIACPDCNGSGTRQKRLEPPQ